MLPECHWMGIWQGNGKHTNHTMFQQSDKKYVPPRLHQKIFTWAHTSATGHPGTRRTLDLLKETSMIMCGSCSVCAQAKVHVILPLENPQRPWSHIAIDFITDLPESEGETTLMVVIYRSLAIKLLLLNALSTALECAEMIYIYIDEIFQHVFRFYGLPEDIVCDRGP